MTAGKFLSFTFLFMASASSVLSQSVLKPSDASEAVEIAHRFAESLDRHKDIAPSLNNLFAKDFIARFRYNCANSHFLKMLDPKVAKKATSHELKSFFVNTSNLVYLGLNHYAAFPPPKNCKDLECMPATAGRILKQHYGDRWNGFDEQHPLKTIAAMREFTEVEAEINRLLKRDLTRITAAESKAYHERLKEIRPTEFYKPVFGSDYSSLCNKSSAGEAHLIQIAMPFFYITLERIDGKLRIIWAEMITV